MLRGNVGDVVRHYEAALAFAPDDEVILSGAALRFAGMSDPALRARARELADRLVAASPSARSFEVRAVAELASGDRDAAVRSFDAARAAIPPEAPDGAAERARLDARQRALLSAP